MLQNNNANNVYDQHYSAINQGAFLTSRLAKQKSLPLRLSCRDVVRFSSDNQI